MSHNAWTSSFEDELLPEIEELEPPQEDTILAELPLVPAVPGQSDHATDSHPTGTAG